MSSEKIPPPPSPRRRSSAVAAPAVAASPPERSRRLRLLLDAVSGVVNGLLFWAGVIGFVMFTSWCSNPSGAISRIPESTPNLETKVMATTIANAVEQYLMESGGRFPTVRPTPASGRDAETDTSRASRLIADLLGKGPGRFRDYDFLDGFQQAKVAPETPTGWRSGLFWEEPRFAIYDAWGGWFRVRLDTGGDGCVDNPNPDQTASGKARLRRKVILWSAGKDGNWETWKDNITSWE